MKIIKTLGKIVLGLVILLVALFGLGYILTIGEYTVPKTVDQDPSLPSITIDGYTYHAETYGDPANPVVIILHGGPGVTIAATLPCRRLLTSIMWSSLTSVGAGYPPGWI